MSLKTEHRIAAVFGYGFNVHDTNKLLPNIQYVSNILSIALRLDGPRFILLLIIKDEYL